MSFNFEYLQEHAIAIQKSIREIDWHCKLVSLHAQLAIGPIDGTRPLTQDQRAIVIGFLTETCKQKLSTVTSLVSTTAMNDNIDPLVYLTGQALRSLLEYDDYSEIACAGNAVQIARAAIAEIENQAPNLNPTSMAGTKNGWRFVIIANDVYADGTVDRSQGYYAELISLHGDRFRTEDGDLPFIRQFIHQISKTYPDGRIDPSGILVNQLTPIEWVSVGVENLVA